MEQLHNQAADGQEKYVGGAVLIGSGALMLLAQFVELRLLTLPLLSAIFLLAGLFSRQAGWFIPAGVVGGIGLGALMIDGALMQISEQAEGGIFLLCFALGWASIYILSKLFTSEPQRWALIPGAIMAFIGGAVLLGEDGKRFLEVFFGTLSYVWPLALIAGGIYLLVRRGRAS